MIATRVTTDVYARVQHFYARQMQALDDRRFEEYAATFTEDGVFQHSPDIEPARGRAAILDTLVEFDRRFADDPVRRRHWYNQILLEAREDGSLGATVYTLVVHVRPGVRQPEIAPSCVVHDVLELTGDDDVLTRSRLVAYDHLA
jgi:actinorhodin biosynthesis protein ActVIA